MNKDDMSGNLVFEENCPMEIDERETNAPSSSFFFWYRIDC